MVSIIITAYNQLEYTKLCVESILKNTTGEYELILINNGSTDGTKGYFQLIKSRKENVIIINYDNNEIVEDIGNEAVKSAKGEYIVGATNDIIVPKNWLTNMMDCINLSENIGMVGVRSNCIGSYKQRLFPGLYESLEEYYKVAGEYEDKKNNDFEIDKIVGMFCLFRRKCFLEVGGLNIDLPTNGKDGGYGFSDDDLCNKFIKAGYKLMIANDVFIHHFGSVTAKSLYKNMEESQKINERKYVKSN